MPKEKFNPNQKVTDDILAALKEGIVPWQRPWRVDGGTHINLKSKKPYRGINQLLLDLTAMTNEYRSPYWLTFKQASELCSPVTFDNGKPMFVLDENGKHTDERVTNDDGQPLFLGGVRKGEKGTGITFWKRLKVEDKATKDEKFIPLLRCYTVFNSEQLDGIEGKLPAPKEPSPFSEIEVAEAIWKGYENPPSLSHGGDRACYSPKRDAITMPMHEQFDTPEAYYTTLFHEAAHSTGHATRLSRDGVTKDINFGSDPYTKEELVAEIAAVFLSTECGIVSTFDNSVAYLENWSRKLRSDEKFIVDAARQAQKVYDHILGVKWENNDKEETDASS